MIVTHQSLADVFWFINTDALPTLHILPPHITITHITSQDTSWCSPNVSCHASLFVRHKLHLVRYKPISVNNSGINIYCAGHSPGPIMPGPAAPAPFRLEPWYLAFCHRSQGAWAAWHMSRLNRAGSSGCRTEYVIPENFNEFSLRVSLHWISIFVLTMFWLQLLPIFLCKLFQVCWYSQEVHECNNFVFKPDIYGS